MSSNVSSVKAACVAKRPEKGGGMTAASLVAAATLCWRRDARVAAACHDLCRRVYPFCRRV
eukprot:3842545-Pleurochrysis_carterae.AAC.1